MKFCPAAKLVMNLYKKAKKELSKLICSSCYACKGMYLFPNVRDSLQGKADFLLKSLREDNGDTFVKEMCLQIEKAYFKKGEKKKLKNLDTNLFEFMIRATFLIPLTLIAGFVLPRGFQLLTFGFQLVNTFGKINSPTFASWLLWAMLLFALPHWNWINLPHRLKVSTEVQQFIPTKPRQKPMDI